MKGEEGEPMDVFFGVDEAFRLDSMDYEARNTSELCGEPGRSSCRYGEHPEAVRNHRLRGAFAD